MAKKQNLDFKKEKAQLEKTIMTIGNFKPQRCAFRTMFILLWKANHQNFNHALLQLFPLIY